MSEELKRLNRSIQQFQSVGAWGLEAVLRRFAREAGAQEGALAEDLERSEAREDAEADRGDDERKGAIEEALVAS